MENRNNLRKVLGIKKSSTVIIFAARVDPMKNHISCLKAFEETRKKNKKLVLVLIGKETNILKAQEGVIYLGMKTNIENFYSIGDFIILPSKFGEGFSNVLAEGMLCKLIPIATNVGDSFKIISNIGVKVKSPNSKDLAAALYKASKISKREISILQTKARARIIKEFNIKKMSISYNNIYKELV
tara:strand:- start:403 stop:957 length:555 start_codon:yes stop_codon:yes gene_type:complete